MSPLGQKRRFDTRLVNSDVLPTLEMALHRANRREGPNPDSCGASKAPYSITSLARASNGRLMSARQPPADAAVAQLEAPKRIRKGEPQGGVHRFGELNNSINCDGFGIVSKCGASDGIVSQDALDPVYRCAPISRVSRSSSKPAGTQ
jgi:hypothetical protein